MELFNVRDCNFQVERWFDKMGDRLLIPHRRGDQLKLLLHPFWTILYMKCYHISFKYKVMVVMKTSFLYPTLVHSIQIDVIPIPPRGLLTVCE